MLPKLYEGAHAFLLQNPDRRVVFAIPYEGRFTLVGTTDEAWEGAPGRASISEAEVHYLCNTITHYFKRPVTPDSIVWSFSGIRPLYDDKAASASAVTRDYVLDLDAAVGRAPVLSIFGGKITTHRKLAEHALEKLSPFFEGLRPAWTASEPLPGGDIRQGDFEAFIAELAAERPGLPRSLLRRLARAYGTRARRLLGRAKTEQELGSDFGGGLYRAEIDYLSANEWARSAEDILFRRSKLGLHVPPQTATQIDAYLESRFTVINREGRSDAASPRPLREPVQWPQLQSPPAAP